MHKNNLETLCFLVPMFSRVYKILVVYWYKRYNVNNYCFYLECYLFSAFTPKKNYVPIILPNPPAVEDMYDVTIFNPMYPIVNYPKSNLN